MTKLFACFALFCLIGTAFCAVGDACDGNTLLTKYKFAKEDKEISGTALKYCKSLQAGTSCCGASVINTFQDEIDAIAKTLTAAVVKRDTAIVDLRDETMPTLSKKLETLQTNAAAALVKIDAAIAAANDREDETKVKPYELTDAKTLATNLETLAEDAIDNLADITEGFTAFQKARTVCVKDLLDIQAAAMCLACDPTADDQGLEANGAIKLSDETCSRLKGSCYEYVTASVAQSDLLAVGWISAIIDELNAALEDVAEDANEAGLQALADAVQPAEDDVDGEASPVATPALCTKEDDCDWICTSLFVEGKIVEDLLVLGGAADPTPLVATTPVARRLQDEWTPAANEAGVTIEFEDDPAGLNSDDDDDDTLTPAAAGIIKSGFVCVIALLSVFFF